MLKDALFNLTRPFLSVPFLVFLLNYSSFVEGENTTCGPHGKPSVCDGSIGGNVKDIKTGAALSGIRVTIEPVEQYDSSFFYETRKSLQTKTDGTFSFSNLARPLVIGESIRYKLSFTSSTYSSAETQFGFFHGTGPENPALSTNKYLSLKTQNVPPRITLSSINLHNPDTILPIEVFYWQAQLDQGCQTPPRIGGKKLSIKNSALTLSDITSDKTLCVVTTPSSGFSFIGAAQKQNNSYETFVHPITAGSSTIELPTSASRSIELTFTDQRPTVAFSALKLPPKSRHLI